MTECKKCSNWFHNECLGMSKEEITQNQTFHCHDCYPKSLNVTFFFFFNSN